ncbi:putative Ferredoxin--NADP reductase, leaf isozyme 1, chloroplastic [Cocos nucifera]|uniref:Putative Ferredoxin--NADP reductase, leaf isozyme 1, chloroplastic n=1 Tax=Cocos nucifera TaxID=13894 RepID=A0A8K0ILA6_COCNU|nr:putative Ferredoxin--NADP reductase, leaf isozyme 1, chloroplastic [Cocos nucifera]
MIPDGVDKKRRPRKLRLHSIASSALGDFGDSKALLACLIDRIPLMSCCCVYGDMKPVAGIKLTGLVGKEMLVPKDPNANIIMLATGTGFAPSCSSWKMFFEKNDECMQGNAPVINA